MGSNHVRTVVQIGFYTKKRSMTISDLHIHMNHSKAIARNTPFNY